MLTCIQSCGSCCRSFGQALLSCRQWPCCLLVPCCWQAARTCSGCPTTAAQPVMWCRVRQQAHETQWAEPPLARMCLQSCTQCSTAATCLTAPSAPAGCLGGQLGDWSTQHLQQPPGRVASAISAARSPTFTCAAAAPQATVDPMARPLLAAQSTSSRLPRTCLAHT
jgi:hypothetical protein